MKLFSYLFGLLLSVSLITISQAVSLYCPSGAGTLPEKLIVTDSHAILYKDFGTTGISIPPLTILWRLTVDGMTNTEPIVSHGGKHYYHVGSPEGESWGYIDVTQVTSWMTRFVYVPLPPGGDRTFVVYKQPYAKKAFSALTPAQLEVATLATIKEIPAGFGSYAFILNDKNGNTIQQANVGIDPNDFKKVMIYNTPITSEGVKIADKMVKKGPSPDDIGLDIVFVIDTTASMTPLIEMAKNVCKQIAIDIHNDQAISKKVHFGLVNYRDSEYCTYGARIDCDVTASFDEFMVALNSLGDLENSEDGEEDVILGLKIAVDHISWHKLTAKHIIILGDAPNKPTAAAGEINTFSKLYNYTNKDRSANVIDSAFAFIRFNAVVSEDWNEAVLQFKEIAENKGDRKGFFSTMSDPNVGRNLVQSLKEGLYAVRDTKRTTMRTSSGSSVFSESVWDLKELLVSTQSGASISGNKVTGFACARTSQDTKCADLNIFVLRKEMELFHDQLSEAYRRLDKLNSGNGGNVKVIFDQFLEEYVGITSGTATDEDYDMSIADILKLQMPVKTKTLKMSIRDIMRMNSDARAQWMQEIKQAIDRTQAILDRKEAWTDTFQSSGKSQKFAFISISDLP